MNKELQQLKRALQRMEKPTLDIKTRHRMRVCLMKRMEETGVKSTTTSSLENVSQIVKRYASVRPSATVKAKMKEVVMKAIAQRPIRLSSFSGIARQWQKVLATLLITVLSFTSLTVYFSDIPVIRAAQKTTFQHLYGDVDVLREGESIEAYRYMTLQEDDIIVTGENGLAIIRYFDDSVSRLSPRTELKIHRLYQDNIGLAKTEVEVELTRGRMWNQVVNLVDDQGSFEVITDTVKARTSEKASFDIVRDDVQEKVAVAVFENKVEVRVPEKRKEHKKVVVEGYAYEVDHNRVNEEKIALHDEEEQLWVTVNQTEDKNYKKQVEEEKDLATKEEAGVLPSDPFYSAKKLNETTKLLVTTDTVERDKIRVDIAVKRLTEAGALLSDGNEEDAHKVLEEFSKRIEEVQEAVQKSPELQEYVYTSFASKAKDYSTTLPDSPRYKAKEALREAKLSLALSDEEKSEVTLKNANERVLEARELFGEQKQDHAQETLLQATQDIVKVAQEDDNKSVRGDEQKEETLSTVRVLKGAVEEDETVTREVKHIIDVAEEALEEVEDPIIESDSAVVISIDEELDGQTTTVQLKEVQE
ncbi:hypothetical protein GF369_00460 [Candidatus Peregrinibacteria bacterium]|nr:hypothetical protein [Candidatus Peregrinibacteria bacterium]